MTTATASRPPTQSFTFHETERSSDEEEDHDGSDDVEMEDESESDVPEKDDEEKELERLIFGTSDEYRQEIGRLADSTRTGGWAADAQAELEEDDAEAGLDQLEDSQVNSPFLEVS
jgi:hypothetical protein